MKKEEKEALAKETAEQEAAFKRVAREIGCYEVDLHKAILWAITHDVKGPNPL